MNDQPTWWHEHSNLVLLTRYMADAEYSAEQIAYAVEKPSEHEHVLQKAIASSAQAEGVNQRDTTNPRIESDT